MRDGGGLGRALGRGFFGLALGAALAVPMSAPVAAQDWPTRPVTIIVPYSAGGHTDTMARLVGNYMTAQFGQSFMVENQPTAGGVVGTTTVARAEPDGYTLYFGPEVMIVIRPILQELDYDDSNFVPVSIFGESPYILAVRTSLGVETLEEFVALAKEKPGELNYSSAGTGGNVHLTSAMFATAADIEINEIPYPGGGPASNAFIGGEVDMYFGNASEVVRYADDPNIRILAVASPERLDILPDVPALAEFFPGFQASTWNGFLAPAGTPDAIVEKLHQATRASAEDPEIASRMRSLGIDPVGGTPEEFAKVIEDNKSFYRTAIEAAGVEVQ